MQKKILPIACLCAVLVLVSGCDFLRRAAGRPTSKDIEAKKALIAAEQDAHARRLDSMKLVQKQISDSLAVIDSIKASKSRIMQSRMLSEQSRTELQYRYYIILGSFARKENAVALSAKVESKGYPVTMISYRNGFTAVALCPADNVTAVFESLNQVKKEDFCPEEAWILDCGK